MSTNGSNLINRYNKTTKTITKQIVAILKKGGEAPFHYRNYLFKLPGFL